MPSAATKIAPANCIMLYPLPSGREMHITPRRRIYFVDHNTRTTTSNDPQLLLTADTDPLQQRMSNDWRKNDSLWSQLSRRLIADAKCDLRVRCGWVIEDCFSARLCVFGRRTSAGDLWSIFEGEGAPNFGGVFREWFFLSHVMLDPS